MLCIDLISNVIAPLKTSDTGLRALGLMEEFKVTHLPVVNHTDYLGLFSEEDVFNLNSPEESIGNHALTLERPSLLPEQHVFEALKQCIDLNLSIMPVVSAENEYLGSISLKSLIENLSEMASVRDYGAILVLEIQKRDYNLSQIAQIFESNNVKILSLFLKTYPDSNLIDIIIKLNTSEIASCLQTLERYNYKVKYKFNTSDKNDNLKDRYDLLMNYLEL